MKKKTAIKGPLMTPLKAAKQNYETVSNLDQEERNRILMENLAEVHYIAKRIHDRLPSHVLLEDLVHAGVVGLLEAIRNFDPSRGVQVKTYAKLRIHGAILDSLRGMDWGPRSVRRHGRELDEAHQRLRAKLGRDPSEEELAEEMGMDLDEIRSLLLDLRGLNLGSIQAIEDETGWNEKVFKYVPYSPEDDPYYLCLQSEMHECLAKAIEELPERERQLLALYYNEELTMKEVGAVLGVGEGRVSQIHSAAMAKLRSRLQEMLGHRPENAVQPQESTKV